MSPPRDRCVFMMSKSHKQSSYRRSKAASDLKLSELLYTDDADVDDINAMYEDDEPRENKKKNLINESTLDIVVETIPRKGKKKKPFHGTKTLMPGHVTKTDTGKIYHRGRVPENENFIDEILDLNFYGYDFTIYNTDKGRNVISMVYQMFAKHNVKYFSNHIYWLLCHADLIQTFYSPEFEDRTIKTLVQRLYYTRKHVLLFNAVYGPAFVPHNYYLDKQRNKVQVLHIPEKRKLPAQDGFYNKNYSEMDPQGLRARFTVKSSLFREQEKLRSQLNGANGEHTGTDDVKRLIGTGLTVEQIPPQYQRRMLFQLFINEIRKAEDLDETAFLLFDNFYQNFGLWDRMSGTLSDILGVEMEDEILFCQVGDDYWILDNCSDFYSMWTVVNNFIIEWYSIDSPTSIEILSLFKVYGEMFDPHILPLFAHLVPEHYPYIHRIRSFLNGNNGEATNADDVSKCPFKVTMTTVQNLIQFEGPDYKKVIDDLNLSYLRRYNDKGQRQELLENLALSAIAKTEGIYRSMKGGAPGPQTVGRSNGNRMVDGKVINQGAGGNSKLNKPPVASDRGIEAAGGAAKVVKTNVANEEVEDTEAVFEKPPRVMINANHVSKSTFTREEMEVLDLDKLKSVDYNGAPYCGRIALLRGKGIPTSEISQLVPLWFEPGTDPYRFGTDESMLEFAHMHGVNLLIVQELNAIASEFAAERNLTVAPGENPPYRFKQGYKWLNLLETVDADPNWLWVILKYSNPNDGPVGHFTLMVDPRHVKNKTHLRLPQVKQYPTCTYFEVMQNFEVTKYVQDIVDADLRPPEHKRDEIEEQDIYACVDRTQTLVVNYSTIKETFYTTLAVSVCMRYPIAIPVIAIMYGRRILDFYTSEKEFVTIGKFPGEKDILVSVMHAQSLKQQCELKKPEEIVFHNLLRNRTFNTNANLEGIMTNTRNYMEYYAQSIHSGRIYPKQVGPVGLKIYNHPNTDIFIKDDHVANILNNQASGDTMPVNHFTKIRAGDKSVVINKPVATAPIGAILTDDGYLGPGSIPVTDQLGIIAAVAGRSMSKELVEENEVIQDFIKVSKDFLRTAIDSTDVSSLVETEPEVFFREHYRGKRSSDWIDSTLRSYSEAMENPSHSAKHFRNSAFVKLENSGKRNKKSYQSKPRLIMVMNLVALVQYCQFLKIIDRWNHSSFSLYQVKDLSLGEMIEKIQHTSDMPHNVTDYSSFEQSIIGEIRGLENWLIIQLLDKAGFHRTKRCFVKNFVRPRTFRTKGVEFVLDSRCSGDFHTSFGNGVINVCVMNYCAHINGVPLKMIAEGDDALVHSSVPNKAVIGKLGLEFSEDTLGLKPGDTDFLRRRWMDGLVYINIGRALSTLWVKDKAQLKLSKQKFILRCMGCSLHHMSPGHPVLFALVNRIGKQTAAYRKSFSGWRSHIDQYKHGFLTEEIIDNYPRDVKCNEQMRSAVAAGAVGFPPIPVCTQIELERIFMNDEVMYISSVLADYEETTYHQNFEEVERAPVLSDNFRQVLEHLTRSGTIDNPGLFWSSMR